MSGLGFNCLITAKSFKILPMFDCKRRVSKERESVYTIWNACLPERYVYNFDRTLERTASFEPDKRSVVAP